MVVGREACGWNLGREAGKDQKGGGGAEQLTRKDEKDEGRKWGNIMGDIRAGGRK